MSKVSYHDLHITTPKMERTSIFDLPFSVEVACCRVAGWQVWEVPAGRRDDSRLLGAEYGEDQWLVLDVAGHVICDSRPATPAAPEEDE